MQHATDSASTAGCMATGHKSAVGMLSVNLYEEDASTIVEDAMMCGKAGGVVTSVPVLHATPAAFVSHSNNRKNAAQLKASFKDVNPTLTMGACNGGTQPSEAHKESMLDGGALSSSWTFLYQGKGNATADNFYDSIQDLDPDEEQHLLVCLGGQYSESKESNLPFRGLDSTYDNRWCGDAEQVKDIDDKLTGYLPNSKLCDHYSAAEVAEIPSMAKNVAEAIKFLGKDDDGFFMMYEQGDVSSLFCSCSLLY
jgi:alkaline phosphatase